MFADCSSLSEIEFSEGIRIIEGNAFLNCSSLEKIKLPRGMTTLEDHAFEGCNELKEIEIPETVINLGTEFFYGCSKKLLIKTWPGSAACEYKNYIGITIEIQSPYSDIFTMEEQENYTAIITGCKKPLTSLTIPTTVTGYTITEIADSAFANAYNSLVFYVTDSVKAFLQSVEEIYKGKIDWIYKTLEEWED